MNFRLSHALFFDGRFLHHLEHRAQSQTLPLLVIIAAAGCIAFLEEICIHS